MHVRTNCLKAFSLYPTVPAPKGRRRQARLLPKEKELPNISSQGPTMQGYKAAARPHLETMDRISSNPLRRPPPNWSLGHWKYRFKLDGDVRDGGHEQLRTQNVDHRSPCQGRA